MDTRSSDVDIRTRKFLFLTNAESGQANTILAMAVEALTRPQVEVHVASFPILKRRVERLSPKLKFHALDGKDMVESLAQRGFSADNMSHPPGREGFAAFGRPLGLMFTGWDNECMSRSF